MSQGERQHQLYHREEPTRTTEVASNVATIEELPVTRLLPPSLRNICRDFINYRTYSLIDVCAYMEGMSIWQR